MKKFIAAIILAVFTLSGCDMVQRYTYSPQIADVYSEYRIDRKHMDSFDGMFTMIVCGYELTLPMMESQLPEGFTLEGTYSSRDYYSSTLKYEGINVCYAYSVDSGSDKMITGAAIDPLSQVKICFANGADMDTLKKEDLDELFGEHKEDSKYKSLIYSDGKRLCAFYFSDDGYYNLSLYCDPVTLYYRNNTGGI